MDVAGADTHNCQMNMTVADVTTLHRTLMNAHQLQVYFNMFSDVVTKKMPWSYALHSDQHFEGREQSHDHIQVSEHPDKDSTPEQ